MIEELAQLVEKGGPEPAEYGFVSRMFSEAGNSPLAAARVREVFAPTMTAQCIHGHGFLKPRGYSGDFEMIDRIYTHWTSSDPTLTKWDAFFHAQPAPSAVRNRKDFFKTLLGSLNARKAGAHVLNLGSGSGRDMFEFFQSTPSTDLAIDCIDLDQSAIAFAKRLCGDYADRVSFELKNALRYRPTRQYDLIWSAGLFDYLTDKTVVTLIRRLQSHLAADGKLVIGNFCSSNASRAYMEVLAEWHLAHRSKDTLMDLAKEAGVSIERISIDQEPLGINLFLRISAPDHCSQNIRGPTNASGENPSVSPRS